MTIIYNKQKNGWDLVDKLPERVPHLVEIDIKVAGICRTDVYAMEGKSENLLDGRILGHEASGVISSIPKSLRIKAGKKGLDVGSKVAFFPFLPCNTCKGCEEGMEKCFNPLVVGRDVDGAFCSKIYLPVEVIEAGCLSFKELAYMEPLSAAMSLLDVDYGNDSDVGIVGSGRIADICLKIVHLKKDDAFILNDKQFYKNSFDMLIETRADEKSIKEAVNALRPGGVLIVKSRPAKGVIWPHQEIVMKRLKVFGSPYGRFLQAIRCVERRDIDIQKMLGESFEMSESGIERALEKEREGGEGFGKLFFNVGDGR